MSDERPTFGSLFAGIGGIDLGLERAGWRGRWQVEWDAWCRDRLADRWPDLTRYGDITGIDWGTVERVDLLAGGFPCQPVSAAGRQAAQADARWLWPEFHRAIRDLRPRLVLMENVTNLLSVGDGSAFGDVIGDLATSGYDTEWDCIPAAAVGAPHDRDRLFLVAYPQGDGRQVGRAGDHRRDDPAAGGIGVRSEPGGDGASGDPMADPGRIGSERWGGAGDVRRSTGPPQGEAPQREWRRGAIGDSGEAVADATSDGRGAWRSGDSPEGTERREPYRSGVSGPLAHSDSGRRRPIKRDDDAGQPDPARGGSIMADAIGSGQPRSRELVDAVHPAASTHWQATGPLDGRVFDQWRTQPGLGGTAHGIPTGLDHCWPAPPGPQYDWEPPRTIVGRVPDRTRRLKACGNAVVPQVVEPIGRWLLEALR